MTDPRTREPVETARGATVRATHRPTGGASLGGGVHAAVRVKICGVTSVADASLAVAAGAEMIGLNFVAGSPRRVDAARATEIASALPEGVWRVGVFVDATREEIERLREQVGLSAIQLHGAEPPELAAGWPVPVIRAVRLRCASDAVAAARAIGADYVLCEGASSRGLGGVGAAFDWGWARALPAERLFVAGGLTPENVASAVRTLRPFAVDVASGVERAPGVKDPARVAAFIENAKAA